MLICVICYCLRPVFLFFFFQAEDGIRDLVRSRGLGDVYKRQFAFSRLPARPVHEEVVMAKFSVNANRFDPYKNFKLSLIHI